MSRIDEALRRSQGGAAVDLPTEKQLEVFAPAWTVTGAPETAPAPAPTPIVTRGAPLRSGEPPAPDGMLRLSTEWKDRLAAGGHGDPTLIEQFRRLAGTLHRAHRSEGLRSVMVTSALPGDGKTLTAVNLALVLAESYRYNVLLIDADLRRPSIPSVVNLSDGGGLSEVLRASGDQKLALVPIAPGLTLLPAGQPIANSLEALTSPRMLQILQEASLKYDLVILDAPPIGPTADARLITQMVGGTLFVVRAGCTQYTQVKNAIDTIGRDHIMGVVLNGVDKVSGGDPYYGEARDPGRD